MRVEVLPTRYAIGLVYSDGIVNRYCLRAKLPMTFRLTRERKRIYQLDPLAY